MYKNKSIVINELVNLPEINKYLEYQNDMGVMFVLEELTTSIRQEDDMSVNANKLLGEKLIDSYLVDNPSVNIQKQRDYIKLLDVVDAKIDEEISENLKKYNLYEIVVSMITLSGILSKISFGILKNNNEGFVNMSVEGLNNELNLLINAIRKGENEGLWNIRSSLGVMKRSVELAINYAFMSKKNDKADDLCRLKRVEYKDFLKPFCAKLYIFQIRSAKKFISDFSEVIINSEGIYLPTLLTREINGNMDASKDICIDVYNSFTDKIYKEFEKSYGYSPYDLCEYVYANDDDRAIKMNMPIIITPKLLMWGDISCFFKNKVSLDNSKKLIECLVLGKNDLKNKINIIEFSCKRENRIFYSPIIEVDDYYIFSPWNLKEATEYFPLRILKRDLSVKFSKKVNGLIKKYFDEIKLSELDNMLRKVGKITKINYDLGKNDYLKKDLESVKGIPHELDLLFFNDRELVIVDSKNYHIEFSIKEMDITKNKIRNEESKLRRIRKYFLDNKDKIEKSLGHEFDTIKLVILTVNPTLYERISHNNDISVSCISNFIKEFIVK